MNKAGFTDDEGKAAAAPVARLSGVSLRHGKTLALDAVNLELPAGRMLGVIGPDGVGKSSLLSLIAGAHVIQQGEVVWKPFLALFVIGSVLFTFSLARFRKTIGQMA